MTDTTPLSFADNGFEGEIFDKIMQNDTPAAPADLDDLFIEKLLADAEKTLAETTTIKVPTAPPSPVSEDKDSSPIVFKDPDDPLADVTDVFE